MINIKDVKVDMTQFDGMLATAVDLSYKFIGNDRTEETDGFCIQILLPNMNFKQLNLRVRTLSDDFINTIQKKSTPIPIVPSDDFTAKQYMIFNPKLNKTTYCLSLRADTAALAE